MAQIGRAGLLTSFNEMTPVQSMVAVTPSDSVPLTNASGQVMPPKALIIQGAGSLALKFQDGTQVTLTVSSNWFGVQYISPAYVMATGTTISASLIHACY
jgi:hypothetical protein